MICCIFLESNNYLNDASDNQGLQKPKIVKKELKIHKLEENEEQLLSNLIRDNGTEDEKYNTSVEDKEFPISIKGLFKNYKFEILFNEVFYFGFR